MQHRLSAFLCTFVLITGLSACDGGGDQVADPRTPQEIEQAAAIASPQDKDLAEKYSRSCRSCHAITGTGAPLTTDVRNWAPRLAKGEEVLLSHTINGFEGMPPMGLCPDCSDQDYTALIGFMSSLPTQN